ncbi:hypothetical protein LIER_16082 [Lithospermum erythrorhizon]|uniref:Uncharacterized protein n=1 Tax=Lithospermum erythrorhizon TaxID=34254 RepID=A0AAV3Q8H8_LITER
MSYHKSKSYLEEVCRRDYNARRNHRRQHRRYRSPRPFRNQHAGGRDYGREYYSSTSDNTSWSPSRDNQWEKTNRGKAPTQSPEGNNRQEATMNPLREQDTVDLFMNKFGASIIAEEDEEAFMNLKQKP